MGLGDQDMHTIEIGVEIDLKSIIGAMAGHLDVIQNMCCRTQDMTFPRAIVEAKIEEAKIAPIAVSPFIRPDPRWVLTAEEIAENNRNEARIARRKSTKSPCKAAYDLALKMYVDGDLGEEKLDEARAAWIGEPDG